MSSMFNEASVYTANDLSKWDVPGVTKTNRMFQHCYECDVLGLNMWNVSRVTNMEMMFAHTASGHGSLSKWDVSKVTDMNGMFSKAYGDFSDLDKWDVSVVMDMREMFFQVGPKGNLSKWNISKDAKVEWMFDYCACSACDYACSRLQAACKDSCYHNGAGNSLAQTG